MRRISRTDGLLSHSPRRHQVTRAPSTRSTGFHVRCVRQLILFYFSFFLSVLCVILLTVLRRVIPSAQCPPLAPVLGTVRARPWSLGHASANFDAAAAACRHATTRRRANNNDDERRTTNDERRRMNVERRIFGLTPSLMSPYSFDPSIRMPSLKGLTLLWVQGRGCA